MTEKTKSVLTEELTDWSRRRGDLYHLLSGIYLKELTKEQIIKIREPEFLITLAEQGVELEGDFLDRSIDDELVKDMAVEYAKIFIGPGKHVAPYESVHHKRKDGDWGQYWGKDTVLVKKYIEWTGLEYKEGEFKNIPDHIGVELEFMYTAIERQVQALEENDTDMTAKCLEIEQKFLDDHLTQWVHIFCDKVVEKATLSFYREMAELTKSFVEFDKKIVGEQLAKLTE